MTSRVAAVGVVVVVAVAAACAVWAALERSTIPLALEGRVDRVVMRHGKLGGSDDVWQLWFDDGTRLSVDRSVAAVVTDGAVVRKASWERSIEVDGRPLPLSPSDDVERAAILGLVAVVVGALVVRRAVGRPPDTPRPDAAASPEA